MERKSKLSLAYFFLYKLYYFFKINLKLYIVIKITLINQIIIQTDSGTIQEKAFKSELGQTLKSSIINIILEIHKNCKTKLSYLVYFAKANNIADKAKIIKLETTELNQNIATKTIKPAKK